MDETEKGEAMNCHPADHRPDPEFVFRKTAACRNFGCDVLLVATGPCERCEGRGRDFWGEACLECDGTGLEGWGEAKP